MPLPIFNRLFNRSAQPSSYLVLKISPDRIQAAIFQPPQELKQEPGLLGTGQAQLSPASFRGHQLLDFDALLQNTSLALEQALLAAEIKLKDTEVMLLWPAGLAKLVFLTVRFTRQNPSDPINSTETKNILTKVQEETLAKAKQSLSQLVFPWQEYQLASLLPINYRVNQQNVANPIGLPADQLEISLAYHFIQPDSLAIYTDLLSQLGLQPRLMLDSHFALTFGLSRSHSEGLVLQVEKESTHLGLFEQNRVRQIDSFNLGANYSQEAEELRSAWLKGIQLKLAAWQQDSSGKIFLTSPARQTPDLNQLDRPVQTLDEQQILAQLSHVYPLL